MIVPCCSFRLDQSYWPLDTRWLLLFASTPNEKKHLWLAKSDANGHSVEIQINQEDLDSVPAKIYLSKYLIEHSNTLDSSQF